MYRRCATPPKLRENTTRQRSVSSPAAGSCGRQRAALRCLMITIGCVSLVSGGAMSGALLPGVRLRADCAPPRPTLRDRRPFVLWNQSMTRSAPLPLLRTPALTRWDLVTLRYAATATSIRSTCTCSGLGRSSRPTPWASCAPPTPAKDRCEQG